MSLPKDGDYSRYNMPFYMPDNVYAYLIATGEEPEFPPYEDLPRSEQVSFDVHYFVTPNDKVHRITVTR